MEFFDEAFSKAKGAFDVACKKTNEVVSLQKQKFDVAALESKLSKDYETLGRLCIDAIEGEGEFSQDILALAADIRAKETEIENRRTDILLAQGKKFCANCGASNMSEAHYCYVCGTSFIEETKDAE